jgi:hypothetical protein
MENNNYPEVYISFRLSPKANEFLTEAANRAGRSKKIEAKMRLESHLRYFESILNLDSFTKKATT